MQILYGSVCYVILNNLQTTINQNVELIICVEGREETRVSSDEWCMEVPSPRRRSIHYSPSQNYTILGRQ